MTSLMTPTNKGRNNANSTGNSSRILKRGNYFLSHSMRPALILYQKSSAILVFIFMCQQCIYELLMLTHTKMWLQANTPAFIKSTIWAFIFPAKFCLGSQCGKESLAVTLVMALARLFRYGQTERKSHDS